ncbi:pepsin-like aspartic protease [Shewanella sedimentimangrovi]|uniref:pepsin-like aspartic protease n=1 Tax=Shewanella sedimentimangrovi TaxID=2814293 RepID=UPI001E497FBB|nr:pepsin-like aspartic protease [Shewanella sedimentimangrovi]
MTDTLQNNSASSEQPAQTHARVLALPLTNVLAEGGYSAAVRLGSQQDKVNLIIDTGSSTLVVHENRYQPKDDKNLSATTLAQEVCYGQGGWLGPVVHTRFEALDAGLEAMPLALVHAEAEHSFLDCDGIWGMAYHSLNRGYNMESYLTEHGADPRLTFPWPFPESGHPLFQSELNDFKQLLTGMPEQDVPTAFTQMEQQGVVSNRFAFIARRSSIHYAKTDLSREQLALDPLNQGWLILGGDERLSRHFEGDFTDLKLVHDRYYNVNLLGLSLVLHGKPVSGFEAISVPSAVEAGLSRGSSNAILDTGASLLALPAQAFDEVIAGFKQTVPNAEALLEPFLGDMTQIKQAQAEGIDMQQLDLDLWPTLQFHFEGVDSESARVSDSVSDQESDQEGACGPSDSCVSSDNAQSACGPSDSAQKATLECPPHCYWQLNSPAPGRAVFKLMGQLPNWPAQSILGLPLLSAYFVLFQRDKGEYGQVRFAKPKVTP